MLHCARIQGMDQRVLCYTLVQGMDHRINVHSARIQGMHQDEPTHEKPDLMILSR
jgi:hypothetical protein